MGIPGLTLYHLKSHLQVIKFLHIRIFYIIRTVSILYQLPIRLTVQGKNGSVTISQNKQQQKKVRICVFKSYKTCLKGLLSNA